MLAEIQILMSWGAVAFISTLILAYLGTVGTLIWKLYAHSSNAKIHLGENEKVVGEGLCVVKHRAIDSEIVEVRKYVGDVEDRTTEAIKELRDDLKAQTGQIIDLLRKK